jgi:hypothetical protein
MVMLSFRAPGGARGRLKAVKLHARIRGLPDDALKQQVMADPSARRKQKRPDLGGL